MGRLLRRLWYRFLRGMFGSGAAEAVSFPCFLGEWVSPLGRDDWGGGEKQIPPVGRMTRVEFSGYSGGGEIPSGWGSGNPTLAAKCAARMGHPGFDETHKVPVRLRLVGTRLSLRAGSPLAGPALRWDRLRSR